MKGEMNRQKKFTYTQFTEHTICQYSRMCVFCSTSFCNEKEKIVADITSIESFTNNCKHTYSSGNSASYHHICNFFSLFFLRGCWGGGGFRHPDVCDWQCFFSIVFILETLAAILPPLMSLIFTNSDNKKWSPNLAWNIKLERVVSKCVLYSTNAEKF